MDGVDAKALSESDPDIGAQAIAANIRDVVDLVERGGRLREEVAEDFADVDEVGCARGAYVGPEGARLESGADAERVADLSDVGG